MCSQNSSQLNILQRFHLRTIDILNIGYLVITGVLIVLFNGNVNHPFVHLGIRLILISGIVILNQLIGTSCNRSSWWQFFRSAYTPLVMIFYFEETEFLNQLIVPSYFDFVVHKWNALFIDRMDWLWRGKMYLDPFLEYWDARIIGFQASLEFPKAMSYAWFSELLHFSYFSYYLLIPLLGFRLWFQRRYKEFDELMVAIAVIMFSCYLFYIVFPTSGPKKYFARIDTMETLKGYVFRPIMDLILKYGEVANGAFPSSHVAMSVGILICAYRYERLIFWIMLPFVLLLFISTIYLREHYVVDVPSGIIAGIGLYLIATPTKNYLDKWLE